MSTYLIRRDLTRPDITDTTYMTDRKILIGRGSDILVRYNQHFSMLCEVWSYKKIIAMVDTVIIDSEYSGSTLMRLLQLSQTTKESLS